MNSAHLIGAKGVIFHLGSHKGAGYDERVGQVADVLRDEGILSEVVDEGDAFRLRNLGCPYRSAAEETHAACAADRRTIELLLGAPVEQITTIVDGAMSCDYLVSKDCEPLPAHMALG